MGAVGIVEGSEMWFEKYKWKVHPRYKVFNMKLKDEQADGTFEPDHKAENFIQVRPPLLPSLFMSRTV